MVPLAAVTTGSLTLILVVLAIIAFGVAIWLTTVHNIVGAIVAGGLGAVILILALA